MEILIKILFPSYSKTLLSPLPNNNQVTGLLANMQYAKSAIH